MDAPPRQVPSSPNGSPQQNILYSEVIATKRESVGITLNYSGPERRGNAVTQSYSGLERRASKKASQNGSDRRRSTGRRAIDMKMMQMMNDALRYKFIYAMTALVIGLCCIVGGMTLFMFGMSGKMSWTIGALGIKSTVADAAPGASLFVVGLFYVYLTRFCKKHW